MSETAPTTAPDEPKPTTVFVLRGLQLLVIALLFVPAIYWRGGILETESPWFIGHYLDDRGVIEKVFDPQVNDFGAYQGRELSYFFDYLDAQAFRAWMQLGQPFFISTSTFLATAALVLIQQWWIRRLLPRLHPVTSILVLLIYLSGFVRLSTDGMYYRSTKPLMVPFIVLGMSLIWYFQRESSSEGTRRHPLQLVFGSLFAIGTTISLLDRMGFYLVTVAMVLTGIHAMWRKGRWDVCLGLMAASAAGLYYNYLLGPMLIHRVNGYWPDFTFQRVKLQTLVTEPWYLVRGMRLLVEQAWFCFGNFAVLLILLATLYYGAKRLRSSDSSPALEWSRVGPPLLYALLAFAAGTLMTAIMLIRHPIIYDLDHRLWYYGLPIQAALLFPVWLGLNWYLAGASAQRTKAVNILLFCLVVSNVLSWGRYQRDLFTGQWYPVSYHQTVLLRQSLAQGDADPELSGNYVVFFAVCQALEQADGGESREPLPEMTVPLIPARPTVDPPSN